MTAEVVYNVSALRAVVSGRLGRKVAHTTLWRWRPYALIPEQQPFFTERDVEKLCFIARYLATDRNLERASDALIEYLEQH